MARRWIRGFDVREGYRDGNDGGSGGAAATTAAARVGPRGHGGGLAYRRRNQSPSGSANPSGSAASNVLSERYYFRLLRLPTTGNAVVYECGGSGEGSPSVRMRITTGGSITWENQGNAVSPSVFYTWAAPVLNVWYLVQTRWQYDTDPTAATNANARIRINGSEVFNGSVAGTGGLNVVQNSTGATIGPSTTATDTEYDIDDWTGDSSEYPVPSCTIRRIIPTGPGFYNEWTVNDWRTVIGGQSLGFSGGTVMNNLACNESSTNGQRVSFAVSLAQLPNLGTVRAIHVFVQCNVAGHTVDVLLRVNGVDTYLRSGLTTNSSLVILQTQCLEGAWFTGSDTVEIGVRKASGAGVLRLLQISMSVEHTGEETTANDETDGAVSVASGTFIGSATAMQQVAIGFQPDFFMAWNQTGYTNGCFAADTFLDRFLSDPRNLLSNFVGNSTITGIHNGVAFIVPLGALGSAGGTYFWLAIKDRQRRVMHRQPFALDATTAYDNTNLALDRADFLPEWVLAINQAIGSTSNARQRDPAHVGDLSSTLGVGSAAVADMIQALATGIIQVGTVITGGGFFQKDFISFRTAAGFTSVKLWDIVTWTGDGTASRTIPLPTITGIPAVAIVQPHNTGITGFRAAAGTVTTQAAGTQTTNGFGLVAGGITVGGTSGGVYNASGVLYGAIAFRTGTDPAPGGEVVFPTTDVISGKMVPLVWVEGLLDS